jgi:hypothetical protein
VRSGCGSRGSSLGATGFLTGRAGSVAGSFGIAGFLSMGSSIGRVPIGCAIGCVVPGTFGSCTIGRCGLRPPGFTFGTGCAIGFNTVVFGFLTGITGAGVGGMRKNPLS